MTARYTPSELRSTLFYAQRDDNRPRSRLELCRLIDRRKSPHILDAIEQLVVDGLFVKWVDQDKHGRNLYLYRAVDENTAG